MLQILSFIDLPGPVELEECSLNAVSGNSGPCTHASVSGIGVTSVYCFEWFIILISLGFLSNGKLYRNTAHTTFDSTSAHCSVLHWKCKNTIPEHSFITQITNIFISINVPNCKFHVMKFPVQKSLQIIWSFLKIKSKSAKMLLGSEQQRNQLLLSHLLKLS